MVRSRQLIYATIIGLPLMVVFVPLSSLTLKGKGIVRGAMAPMERGVSGLWKRLSEIAATVHGIGGSVEKNRELSHKLVHVQAELNRLRDVEVENLRLRRALGFREISPYTMIPCDVVSRNISGWWNTVRIGRGYKEGIKQNHAVITPEGLVGRTTEVTPMTAEVLLLCDPACRVSAKLARTGAFGLVRGSGSTSKGQPQACMEFIDKDAEVRMGDEVVTSGLSSAGGVFPEGVHIGYIEKVYQDETGLFQYAQIVPRATVGLLDYVFVVSDIGKEATP